MGNITPLSNANYSPTKSCCFKGVPLLLLLANPTIKLILCEGTTKLVKGRSKIKAGEIMFEFPDCVVCHADSFFLGRPIPVLAIHDHLIAGHTYFIIPLDRLPAPQRAGGPLSAATLHSLSSPSPSRACPTNLFTGGDNNNNNSNNSNNNKSPFEYVKDKDGRVMMIKVVPEFITRIITGNNNNNSNNNGCNTSPNSSYNLICTTPELQKQYEQLVRAKDQGWSPKLETISEHKIRFSPSRFIRLEWKHIRV